MARGAFRLQGLETGVLTPLASTTLGALCTLMADMRAYKQTKGWAMIIMATGMSNCHHSHRLVAFSVSHLETANEQPVPWPVLARFSQASKVARSQSYMPSQLSLSRIRM